MTTTSSAVGPVTMSLYALVLLLLAGWATADAALAWQGLVARALAAGGATARPLFYGGAVIGVASFAMAVVVAGLTLPSATITPPATALLLACIAGAAATAFGLATRLAARSARSAALALACASLATFLAVACAAVPAEPGPSIVDPALLVVACGAVVVVRAARLALPFLGPWMARGTMSERRALLLDGCDAAIALCDHDHVLVASRSFAASLGFEPEAIERRSLRTLIFFNDGTGSLSLQPGLTLPAMAYSPSGDRIDLEVTVMPLRQPGFSCVELRRGQAASSADPSAAAARTLRRRMARSAASEVSIS